MRRSGLSLGSRAMAQSPRNANRAIAPANTSTLWTMSVTVSKKFMGFHRRRQTAFGSVWSGRARTPKGPLDGPHERCQVRRCSRAPASGGCPAGDGSCGPTQPPWHLPPEARFLADAPGGVDWLNAEYLDELRELLAVAFGHGDLDGWKGRTRPSATPKRPAGRAVGACRRGLRSLLVAGGYRVLGLQRATGREEVQGRARDFWGPIMSRADERRRTSNRGDRPTPTVSEPSPKNPREHPSRTAREVLPPRTERPPSAARGRAR